MGKSGSGDRLKAKPLSSESLRKRRYRQRVKSAEALGLALRADAPPPAAAAMVITGAESENVPGQLSGIRDAGSTLLIGLERLAENENASGQARVSAARTVLEVQGIIGKHARDPADEAAERPVGLLSRAGLERELVRLRRSVMPASRPGK
jgi:hypothetical protein